MSFVLGMSEKMDNIVGWNEKYIFQQLPSSSDLVPSTPSFFKRMEELSGHHFDNENDVIAV